MASSEFSDRDFDARIKRLELLISALIASGLDVDPEVLDGVYFEFLRKYPEDKSRPDPFVRLLRQYAFREFDGFGVRGRINDLQRSINEISEQAQSSQKEWAKLKNKVEDDASKLSSISHDLHAFLALSSLGIPQNEVRLHRFLSMRVYTSNTDVETELEIKKAALKFFDTFGFTVADDFPEKRGSWFKSWVVKSKDALTQPEVLERLQKVEKAAEMLGLEKPQSEVDKAKAEAVKNLMESVKDMPQAAIYVGSILIVKTINEKGPIVQIKSLTSKEIILLENNQLLLESPSTVMKNLSALCRQDEKEWYTDGKLDLSKIKGMKADNYSAIETKFLLSHDDKNKSDEEKDA